MKIFSHPILAVSVLLSVLFVIPAGEIQASVIGVPYFGGIVTAEFPCDTGLLIYVKDAISTPPFFEIVPYMWLTGELPFASYVIPHTGQEILGAASPTPIICFAGIFPIGIGYPIIYHGSSL